MSTKIPILRIDQFLIASIQVALDDHSILDFQQDLLQKVSEEGATGVVIDVTSVDLVDSFMARSLNDAAVAVHLLGAQLAIVGIQPAVAMTLVEMGLTIPNAVSALNLEKGIDLLRKAQPIPAARKAPSQHSGSFPSSGPTTQEDVDHA